MNILDFLLPKNESSKTVGSFECPAHTLSETFLGLAAKIGGVNPASITKKSTKGISVKKNANGNYLITLHAFDPEVTIEWSEQMPINELYSVLDTMTVSNKKVSFVNLLNLDQGQRLFQVAFAS